jgi:hypothetical protein
MVNLRSRPIRSQSLPIIESIFLIIDHVYGRKRKEKKEKTSNEKNRFLAYGLRKVSVCAENLGTFRKKATGKTNSPGHSIKGNPNQHHSSSFFSSSCGGATR